MYYSVRGVLTWIATFNAIIKIDCADSVSRTEEACNGWLNGERSTEIEPEICNFLAEGSSGSLHPETRVTTYHQPA